MKDDHQLQNMRHSLAHLLAAATEELYLDAKPTIGPAIENGFYYDFEFTTPPSENDLSKIEKKMREIIKSWKEFTHKEISEKEAREHFKQNPYKLELIDEIISKGEKITFYTVGEFTDLCRGGHIENPAKDIPPSSWKLSRIAGAYWRGDEKNKMLTRIYGLSFESKEALEEYEKQIEEAKKRDHKKLGRELDLFTFSELVGGGLPLWTPKGTILRDLLDNFVWELRKAHGYERVDIPHITKKELYEKSGHWDKFKEELFHIKTREGHDFVMKPMNCPHHTQIYARRAWSYRELPQRYASTTKVYRDEQSGELGGLSRVRAITQDDAHVFCRQSHVKDEVKKIYDIVSTFYAAFGIPLHLRLSIWDPKHPEKYLGTKEMWKTAVDSLENLLHELGQKDFDWGIGEAAFYGPKIDFLGRDSIGRQWQVATIQLDMNMPERFDLSCINEKGEKEQIVMIHAAIMGSIERFLSVLIEHYAGVFPLWLSPVQVKVIPVRENHNDYAEEIFEALKKEGIRVEFDSENENLGKKVRKTKVEKIPYWVVIGDKEVEAKMVTLESRDKGNLGQLPIEEVIKRLSTEILGKK